MSFKSLQKFYNEEKMVKTCFIASAGFGTRMGELGKVLPKPLWPFGNLRMLDLQVAYAKNIGCQNIFINSHHCHQQMEEWAKGKNVTLIHEPEILGSGGCIHNLKKYVHDEVILIINSDQFYFFDFENIERDYESLKTSDAIAHLYAISVDAKSTYNETVIQNNELIDIVPHKGDENYCTYSGVGLIDLGQVDYIPGSSGFFKTVCDFKSNKVLMNIPDNPIFLDLGTLEKYIAVIKNSDKLPEPILSFLKTVPEFDMTQLSISTIVNWSGLKFDFDNKSIIYKGQIYSF